MQSQHIQKYKKKKAKTSQTRFGPESGTGSALSADPDLGLAKLDPRIRVRIWIMFLKTDLDPGPSGPGPDMTHCHPSINYQINIFIHLLLLNNLCCVNYFLHFIIPAINNDIFLDNHYQLKNILD